MQTNLGGKAWDSCERRAGSDGLGFPFLHGGHALQQAGAREKVLSLKVHQHPDMRLKLPVQHFEPRVYIQTSTAAGVNRCNGSTRRATNR
jgi:hypothetical protein